MAGEERELEGVFELLLVLALGARLAQAGAREGLTWEPGFSSELREGVAEPTLGGLRLRLEEVAGRSGC